MADIVDEAFEREELTRQLAIRNRAVPQMTYTGECHNCEIPIDSGHFCSIECRDDHAKSIWAEQQRKIG